MKLEITIEDYKQAIAQSWDTCSCILAQAIKRQIGPPISVSSNSFLVKGNKNGFRVKNNLTVPLVTEFDRLHGFIPSGESNEALLQMLPLTVEVEEVIE